MYVYITTCTSFSCRNLPFCTCINSCIFTVHTHTKNCTIFYSVYIDVCTCAILTFLTHAHLLAIASAPRLHTRAFQRIGPTGIGGYHSYICKKRESYYKIVHRLLYLVCVRTYVRTEASKSSVNPHIQNIDILIADTHIRCVSRNAQFSIDLGARLDTCGNVKAA